MENGFKRWTVLILFLLSAIWYFFPIGNEIFPRELFRMRLALPAAVLALGGIGLVPRLISVGFLFCTIGDAMGVAGSFEGQIAGFAVAQICFSSQFVKDIRSTSHHRSSSHNRNSTHIRNTSHNMRWTAFLVAGIVCVIPLIFAAINIIPGVKSLPIRIGCIVYALLLASSLFTSIVRCFSCGRYLAMIGCTIFLVSDFIIAWNKFTCHLPHAGLNIMITYYTALLLIFTGTLRSK